QRGLAAEARRPRKRRLVARLAAPVLERLEQRRLLAEDVASGRNEYVDRESVERAGGFRPIDLANERAPLAVILVPDVHDRLGRADDGRRDRDALDDQVRRLLEEHAILER